MPEIPLFFEKTEKMAKKWHFSGGAKIPEFSGISWRVYMARRVPAGPRGGVWPTSPGAFFKVIPRRRTAGEPCATDRSWDPPFLKKTPLPYRLRPDFWHFLLIFAKKAKKRSWPKWHGGTFGGVPPKKRWDSGIGRSGPSPPAERDPRGSIFPLPFLS